MQPTQVPTHNTATQRTALGGELPPGAVDVDAAAAETKVAAAPTAEEDVDADGTNQVP